MKTEEITMSDAELALELLNQHKKAQKQKEIDEGRRKERRRELLLGIKQVYDALGVPHKDQLIITGFELRRKIIGGYTVMLNLTDKNNPVIKYDYEAGRHDKARFYGSGITGRQRESRFDKDPHNESIRSHNNCWFRYKNKQKQHIFYENRIHQCPFCGHEKAQPDKHNWEYRCPTQWFSRRYGLREDVKDMKLEYLHKTPVKYRRCEDCQGMSHKQYLADHTFRYDIDKPKKKLFEALYPSPLEHDGDYFLDKRDRKLQAKQQRFDVPAKNNDVNDYNIDYQHEYTGNVYLMTNNHTKRTKIGMTKNEPKFRESTLQSEDPDVELAFSRNVLMMRDTERYLHERFDDKRYRGEWFDLSDEEIEEAKSLIKRATKETL